MPYIALSVHLDAVLHPVDACRDLSGSFFCGFPQSHEKNTIYGFADEPACTPTCTVVNSFASESDDQLSLQWSIFTCLGNGLVNTVAGNASSHAYTTTIQQRLVVTSHLAETCRHFSWRQYSSWERIEPRAHNHHPAEACRDISPSGDLSPFQLATGTFCHFNWGQDCRAHTGTPTAATVAATYSCCHLKWRQVPTSNGDRVLILQFL